MMSNSQDPTEYEKRCREFGTTPDPQLVAFARKEEEDEKNLLKTLVKNMQNRNSAADYEKYCHSFGVTPNAIVMRAAKELDEEEKAKSK